MTSDMKRPRRVRSAYSSMTAHGEPWVWLTGGSLAIAIAMITGLLGFIAIRGAATFWPAPLELVSLRDGRKALGEVTEREQSTTIARRLVRTANFELSGNHYEWFEDADVESVSRPEWATAVERLEGGRFHGFPSRLVHGDTVVAEGAAASWDAFRERHPAVRRRSRAAMRIDKHDRGELQRQLRAARLAVVQADLDAGRESPRYRAAVEAEARTAARVADETTRLDAETAALRGENEGWAYEFETAGGEKQSIPLESIAQIWQPNRLSTAGKARVYLSRWAEFLGDDPREANSAGGVFPAIWGTVAMTLIMALLVAPFGVLAALYLRVYASRGAVTSAVRIAINNLAGVPSIVYGAFGLGFFCYGLGAGIDELFFKPALVADGQPTFGTGGLLWASLTLALLTLPVVIVEIGRAHV